MKDKEVISFKDYQKILRDLSASISRPLFERKPKFVLLDEDAKVEDFEKASVARELEQEDVVYVLPEITTKQDVKEQQLLDEIDKEVQKDEKTLMQAPKKKPSRSRKQTKQEKLESLEDTVYLLVNQEELIQELEKYMKEQVPRLDDKLDMLKILSFVERNLKKLKSNVPDAEDYRQLRRKKILDKIKSGDFKLLRTSRAQMQDMIIPSIQWVRPKKPLIKEADVQELKDMLQDKIFRYYCLYCQKWETTYSIRSLPEQPTCKNCGSRFLAVFTLDDRKIKKILHKKNQGLRLTKEEKKYFEKAQKSATQLLDYGRTAAIAMAAHGIASRTTARILQKAREEKSPDALYRIILETRQDFAYR